MYGFSDNYIKVKTEYNPKLVNKIKTIKLEHIDKDGIFAF
jgi:threonylcarbamoyladenosine tRNA methylthiotransferase MtaB